MPTITARYDNRYFRLRVSPAWAKRHDNGCLISIGLTVGQDLTVASFKRIPKANRIEITQDEWNHQGCQSSCIRRGGTKCTW